MAVTLHDLILEVERLRKSGVDQNTVIVLDDEYFEGEGDFISLDSMLSTIEHDKATPPEDRPRYVFTFEVTSVQDVTVMAENEAVARNLLTRMLDRLVTGTVESFEIIDVTLGGDRVAEWPLP